MESSTMPERANRMWLRIARRLERLAMFRAQEAMGTEGCRDAVEIAQLAEGCYWRATGDSDCMDLRKGPGVV